jgi:hypothetical protein
VNDVEAFLRDQYAAVRPLDERMFVILVPLTFGRWRVSRADAGSVFDGY